MKLFRICTTLLIVCFCTVSLLGQSYQGRISGMVTDSSGAVIAGAKVVITNVATHIARSLVTNSEGGYAAPDLEPGSYIVSAEAPGFKKEASTPFALEVSRAVRMDLKLVPGQVNETVQVNALETLVDTADSTLNGVLENKAINELPLQGRDFQNLLPLHPGVQRTPGGGFQSITSNGNRPDENNYFIDGANGNDAYYGESVVNESGIQGTPASFLPLDAIQEFNTQESPSAEYGDKPGVVMNLGLKSGTNAIHGSTYYFGRNSALDARNYYDQRPQPVSALIMHEFGASIGGPIKKDKWFYFANYEGIRDKVGNPGVYDSPVTTSLASQLGGIANSDGSPNSASYSLPDAIAYCQQGLGGACTPNPLSMQLTQLFLPNTGFTLKQSDPSAINFDFNNTNRGDNLVVKTDYHWNDHHVLSARYFYSNSNLVEMDTIPLRPEWLSTTSPTTQVFGVNWNWTPNSGWVNEARFSFNRFSEAIFPIDHNVNPTTYGLDTGVTNPGLFGFPRINPGTDAFNYMGGNSSWPLSTLPSQTYNWSDAISYTSGKHALRFGGQFMYGNVNYFRARYGRGRIDFSDLTDFIAGNPHRWYFMYGDSARNVSMKSFGLFGQDTYRASARVTLNLGLRYDVTYPISDSRNLLANYIPVLGNGQPGGIMQVGHGISSPYRTNYNNLSPRLGLAWDVFGNGRTVVRSGFGMIFSEPSIRTFMFGGGGLNLNPSGVPYVDGAGNTIQPSGTITSFLVNTRDTSLLNWGTGSGPIFPASAGQTCSLDSQCDVFAVNPHLRTPYVENWNLNLQQALSRDAMLQIAYVGNHGVNLYSTVDANQVNPALDDGSEAFGRPLNTNCPVAQGGLGLGGPCFPYIGFLTYLGNQSQSIYHSLQVTFTKRYSHGLYLLAGYTYAHAIDTASSNTPGNLPQNSLAYAAERGNSDFDIRNRFTLSVSYDLPSRKAPLQMLEGWQVTTLATLEGGEPFTLYDYNNDVSLTGEYYDRWNMSGPASNIHWSPNNPIPYVDPSTFVTDSSGNVIGGNQQCINAAGAAVNQLASLGCYISGSTVITPPNWGSFGNMGRNIFRGPNLREWNFSVSKTWKFTERFKMQVRGEVFNLLNHPNFDVWSMNNDLSYPTGVGTTVFTPDLGTASNPVLGSGGSRHIQIAAKLTW